MKHILLILQLVLFTYSQAATIYFENFDDLADGTTTDAGGTPWTIDVSGASFVDGDDYFEVRNGLMQARDVNGQVIWNSASMDISGYTHASIRVDIESTSDNKEATDSITVQYILDGASPVTIENRLGDFSGVVTASVDGLSGTSLQVRVVIACNGSGERYNIDNVLISEVNELFSIASSTWDDPTAWSTTSGGAACNCIPGHLDTANIESPDVVDIDSEVNIKDINVASGATLRWTAADLNINVMNSGNIVVNAGGVINRNSQSNASIVFCGGDAHTITSNDVTTGIDVVDFRVTDQADVTFQGTGRIFIQDDLIFSGGSQTITNNVTGTFTVNDRLSMTTAGIHFIHNSSTLSINDDLYIEHNTDTFTNNATLHVADQIRFNRDNSVFVNDGTLIATRLRVESVGDTGNKFENLSGASATFSGDIDLDNTTEFTLENTGDLEFNEFADIDPSALINFTNFAGATMTITGQFNDSDTRLFSSANNTTVTYNRAGDQNIIDPQDSYYNLVIDNGGTKTMDGSFNVDNQLTMTNGHIDANGGTLTLGTSAVSAGTLSYTTGNIANGSFQRWFSASTIADGGIPGFFPVGSTSLDRIFYLSMPAVAPSTGGTVTVSANIGSGYQDVTIVDGAQTVDRIDNGTWSVSTGNGLAGGTYNMQMGGDGFTNIGDVADLRVVLNGSAVGTAGVNSGTTGNPIVQRTGLGLADLSGSFHLGTTDIINSPLPVELISFSVMREEDHAYLEWQTATEINSEKFVIERSLDGEDFEEAAEVSAAGNSNVLLDYEFLISNVGPQEQFFRLRIVDHDGKFEYSKVQSIEKVNNEAVVKYYPNPSNGELFISSSSNDFDSNYSIHIINSIGQEVLSNNIDMNMINQQIIGTETLESGMYQVYISDASAAKITGFKWIVN
ncbi:MAG: T9SS type A sorting domain-containing protein [Flavobacteriales bacterium]|nr:T9SS type A sorting domain-containing protein [Flavobacteriales bacterium]